MAVKLTLDDKELLAAISAHLATKIPTADVETIDINIVSARTPNGPYAEVTFEFEGSNPKPVVKAAEAEAKPVVKAKPAPKVVEPESTVTEEDEAPFEPDEIETSEEEDAADDAAAEEIDADSDSDPEEVDQEEAPVKKKNLFGKKK